MLKLVRWIAGYVQKYPWLIVVLFAALYGVTISEVDRVEFPALSADPFKLTVSREYQFIYGSPLTLFVGNYYQHHGVDARTAFFVVYGLGIALFFVALARLLAVRFEPSERGFALAVICASPLLLIALSWFGKSDTFLLAFYFFFLISRSPVTQTAMCVLMTFCHRELGALVLLVHVWLTGERWKTAIAGLAIGQATLLVYTNLLISAPPMLRVEYLRTHAADLWEIFSSHPIVHLVATLGPFWIYVVAAPRHTWKRAAVLALALAAAIAVYDYTRVFVIICVPLILDVACDVVASLKRDGEIRIGGLRVGFAALWLLTLTQIQVAGMKVFSAAGWERRLGP